MISDVKQLLIIIGIYIVGFCVMVFLLRNEIGEETEDIFGTKYKKTTIDICNKAMIWPGYLFLIILFGPWVLLTELIVKLSKK